jgi:hypothetical protein
VIGFLPKEVSPDEVHVVGKVFGFAGNPVGQDMDQI